MTKISQFEISNLAPRQNLVKKWRNTVFGLFSDEARQLFKFSITLSTAEICVWMLMLPTIIIKTITITFVLLT